MRVLIAGAGGQLGMELATWLRRHRPEWTVHAYRRDAWNVACRCQTEALVRALRPDAIVNCAAFTDVIGESPGIHSGDEADCMFSMHMV